MAALTQKGRAKGSKLHDYRESLRLISTFISLTSHLKQCLTFALPV